MITLSEAVAQELRAELAVREWHMDELAEKSGRSKSTGWRHIKGKSRMSIDDVEAYAHGLGWTLDVLVARARVRQSGSGTADPTARELLDAVPDVMLDGAGRVAPPSSERPTRRRRSS